MPINRESAHVLLGIHFKVVKFDHFKMNIPFRICADMLIYLLMYEGKKQIYGTQASSSRTAGMFIWPIQNPEKVNQLRKEAGFDLTVEENAKRLGASYNPVQKLPDKEK